MNNEAMNEPFGDSQALTVGGTTAAVGADSSPARGTEQSKESSDECCNGVCILNWKPNNIVAA